MSSHLFSSFRLRDLTLPNRIVYSPMGQDAADQQGVASDWHMIHLGSMSLSGAALIFTEATAIEAQGMSTPRTLGLWNDAQEEALKRVIDASRRYSTAKHAVQLWHAGRKASLREPGTGTGELPLEEGGWRLAGASGLSYPGRNNPLDMLDEEGLARVRNAFVNSARRAARIGYDLLELHGAHGYLLHSFLSPLSNTREDGYGGDLAGRMRFPLEVIRAVRAVWPDERPMGIRISATDWIEEGWTIDDSVHFARAAKEAGCDYVTASSGGSSPAQKINVSPGYQVKFAERIRRDAEIPTIAVGQVWEPHFAEFVVCDGHADLVALGRGLVSDPRWPWRAAEALQGEVDYPIQYSKSVPGFMRKNLYRKVSGS